MVNASEGQSCPLTERQMTYLEQLAAAGRPINDADYGSDRQITAENDFFDALDLHLTGKLTDAESDAFAGFCDKATTDERITEGLRLASLVVEV
jgi:aminoglycoside phosphotransferase